ncbi:hypothetical protein ES702_04555 [subsurface metagenome]
MPPGVEMPPGVVVGPGGEVPPGWTPGDPLPPGAIPVATAPPGVDDSGPAPPTYTDVWGPGPVHIVSPSAGVVEATTTLPGDPADGVVLNYGNDWDTVRNTGPGLGYYDDEESNLEAVLAAGWYTYYIQRAFLYFDLSSILATATCIAASVDVAGYTNAQSDVAILKGTQDDTLGNSDYMAFYGDYFDKITWQLTSNPPADFNTFTLDAAGITHVESMFGQTAKFCLREFDHDYDNATPGWTGGWFRSGACFADHSTPAYKPRINITYES